MKRGLTCLLLALFSQVLSTQAQYNKTFYHTIVNGTDVCRSSGPVDIIDNGNNETVTLAHSFPRNTAGLPKYLVLRKLDFSGSVVLERAHQMDIGDVPTRIVKTPDGGYIVVGYKGNNAKFNQIFAMKFDNFFNITWGRVYDDISGYGLNLTTGIREIVNIIQVNGQDDYIIVAPAGAEHYFPIGGSQNNYPVTAIKAIRISGSNGLDLWSKLYYHPIATSVYNPPINPPPAPGVLFGRRECPSALAFGDNKYFIGGVAQTLYYTTSSHEVKQTNFVMAIDDQGTIVNSYKEFAIPGVPGNPYNPNPPEGYSNHDGIFDHATQEFIMSFTIDGFKLANGVNKTEIGIVKFASNLGFNDLKYYFDPSNADHYGYRIKETYARDGYIVSAGVNQYLTANGCTPALLKVDKTGAVQFYHRFNNGQGFHMTGSWLVSPAVTPIMDPSMTIENYAMSCSPVGGHTRIISTDVNGIACGYRHHSPQYLEPGDIMVNILEYNNVQRSDLLALTIYPDPSMTVDIDECDTNRNPDSYKSTAVADVAVNTAKVYPTLLETNNSTISIETDVDATMDVLVSISGVDGRVFESKQIALNRGNNKVSYTLPTSTPGMYLLKLSSDKNELNQVIKIYKQ